METEWFYVGQDIQIQTDNKDFEVGELFDSLGDLITVDEINPNSGEHWLSVDDNIFTFTKSDFDQLKERGFCRIYNIGTIGEHIDINQKSDLEFLKWYKNVH